MSIDTIFAVASGRPPAAVSIIRISGPKAHRAAVALAGTLPRARQAALRELRRPSTGELLDQALILRFDSPASFTGEDSVEFQCHGGRAVTSALLEALASIDGLREARPGEFTRRALENGRIDLTEAEGLADLIEAETESQRKAALAVAEGGLRRQVEDWQSRVLDLSARAEAAIDYVDELDEGVDRDLREGAGHLACELAEWLARPPAERLRDGVRIVVAGPPNSGKSSLLNALVGEDRAIVAASPGTTRDYIDVPLALDGVPLVLTDTAGLRDAAEAVERIGVERASRLVERADIVLWLGDPEDAPAHPRPVAIHARCDLPDRAAIPPGSLAVSAKSGHGLRPLASHVVDLARSLLPGDGQVALNRRQADRVREAEAALRGASAASDTVLLAEQLRSARSAFDRLTGRAGVEAVLDSLFARFCLGK